MFGKNLKTIRKTKGYTQEENITTIEEKIDLKKQKFIW